MAGAVLPGEDPIGKRFTHRLLRTDNPRGHWVEIVGIASDSKYASLSEAASPVIYMPLAQRHETGVVLYVRAGGDLGPIAAQIRREIQAIEPNLPVTDIQTMNDTIGTSLYAPRMGAMLLSVFGGLALLLASLGIYGVLAFSIARRTREIGIRMALGAEPAGVVGLVVREGIWLVAIGLGIGLVGGYYAAKAMRRLPVRHRAARPGDVRGCAVRAPRRGGAGVLAAGAPGSARRSAGGAADRVIQCLADALRRHLRDRCGDLHLVDLRAVE